MKVLFLLLDMLVCPGKVGKSLQGESRQPAATLLLWERVLGQPGQGYQREGEPGDVEALEFLVDT